MTTAPPCPTPPSCPLWAQAPTIWLTPSDTPPASGKEFVEALEAEMKKIGVGEIATVSGRYYAMDRDNRWYRV